MCSGSRGAARWNIDKAGEPVPIRDELEPLRGHCRGGRLVRRQRHERGGEEKRCGQRDRMKGTVHVLIFMQN